MSRLSLRFLGAPQIENDGKPIRINRRKSVALLAYLAVTQQEHSRDALATMFWPEADQSRSRASLRSVLWTLNKTALEEWLAVEAETVALHDAGGAGTAADHSERVLEIDVVRFRHLLSAAKGHDHAAIAACEHCFDLLTEAVALYKNDFLAGFTLPDAPQFDEWHFFQASSLRQKLATALQGLVAFHSASRDFDEAIDHARRLAALDPLHEPAQRSLMQLYAEAGQQSAALRQYDVCRQALSVELGVEPSEETEALYRRIQGGGWKEEGSGEVSREQETLAAAIGPGTSFGPRTAFGHNLPPDPAPFIGRKKELAELGAFLDNQATRLLTISGPGGIGKTRLALAAAREQIAKSNFADGIYFVPLAPLSEPQAIVPAIAEAVGYPFQADKRPAREQLFDFLSQKSVLLVLDNFEHLLLGDRADGAALVANLLQRAPQVKILATSREPLNLYGEQRFPLRGLPVSNEGRGGTVADHAAVADYDAATLFLETVRRRHPDFEIAAADGRYLDEICRLVEGMPLALELAAAWTEVLSLRQIATEIRHNLEIMESNVRNLPARHRSMQAVFDTSWRSLTATEQTTYAQVSVFRGGFTQEAAQAVAGASRQALMGLAHKSLLRFSHSRQRFDNHELLRQYAAARLVDTEGETRERHAAYYAAFLAQRESDLKGPRQQAALAEIEADNENAIAAWRWAVENARIGLLEKSLDPFALFYEMRTRFADGEAVCGLAAEMLQALLADGDGPSQQRPTAPADSRRVHLLAKLLTWQGRFNLHMGQIGRTRPLLARAQTALDALGLEEGDVAATRAFLLLQLADYSIINDFGGKAEALNKESLALYRAIDDEWGTALALDLLSQKKSNRGLHEEALLLHEECLAIRQRLGDKLGIARSYNILGLLVLHIGQIERSEAYLRKSLSLLRTMDNRAHISTPLAVLGINLLFGGKFAECIAAYEECWAIHEELGLSNEPHTANVGMARAKINLGRYEEARRQAQKDLVVYRASGHQWSIAFTLFNLGRIALVDGATAEARQHLEESAAILQKMNERSLLPDVLFCLAYTCRALNERQQAIGYMVEALKMAIETQPLNPMRFELPGMALLMADQEQHEQALEYYTAALQSPYIANSRWFEDIAGRRMEAIATSLAPRVAAAARERGRARDLRETANALLAELSVRGHGR